MEKTGTPPARRAEGRLAFAVLWMIGALVSFSVSAVSIRELARSLSIFELLTLRSGFGVAALVALALAGRGGIARLALHRPALHLLRNAIHWIGQASWAWAVTVLPLATVFAIEFTSPIWTTILALVFLGERASVPRIGAVILGIVGVLLILRPGYLPLELAAAAVLLAAVSFSVTQVTTKSLTRTETTLAILFWMNAMQLPLNLAGCDPAFLSRIEPWQVPAVAGVCVSGLSSHYCVTQALRHADATLVMPMDFLRVPLIALVGWLFYAEALDPMVFLGAACLVAGIGWSLAAASRPPSRLTSPP